MAEKDLQMQSGIGSSVNINGKECSIKPLRLREMIKLNNYNVNNDHGDIDLNVYTIRLHLRDNNNVDDVMDWLLDLPQQEALKEIDAIYEVINALYPTQKKKNQDDQ